MGTGFHDHGFEAPPTGEESASFWLRQSVDEFNQVDRALHSGFLFWRARHTAIGSLLAPLSAQPARRYASRGPRKRVLHDGL